MRDFDFLNALIVAVARSILIRTAMGVLLFSIAILSNTLVAQTTVSKPNVEASPPDSQSPSTSIAVESVSDPPLVQMLLPGFSVRELPVVLNNINNLRYREDGCLYALGYDGDIWLLKDTNGDGVEESAEKFFDNQGRLRGPIGMAVIPKGHALLASDPKAHNSHAQGVVVASKGKVSAILDLDGDNLAEQERIIASGWIEIPQNVDAIGVAIHPLDGAIYFGIGVKDYNKAYQLDEKGKSQFDLNTERGTIQRIEPDLSGRTTVCTGVRFTIGLAFNERHELFATDQEGATWLPNGNPFDELLHIRSSQHYGFPPRHPKHLPNVFDEPSLFDYRPQHQSTCGLAFNLPLKPNGPLFGPDHWRGDAMVCGESRGKLYRTQVVCNADGNYVAMNHLIGCLSMLTVDCCLSPRGDLIVACHSGGPDWGSGPSGKGKIFQIRYDESIQGQPIAAWSSSPHEVRIAFDKPLKPEALARLASKISISYGDYVAAADQFESIRPGYAVTKMQQATPRHRMTVHSASVTPDRQTLILTTDRHRAAVAYAISLPGLGRESVTLAESDLPQLPVVELEYSLSGILAHWKSADESIADWSGWLSHCDFEVASELHPTLPQLSAFRDRLAAPGVLTLSYQLDPRGLFYPAIQPGSNLDYSPQDDSFITKTHFQLRGTQPFNCGDSETTLKEAVSIDGQFVHQIEIPLNSSALIPLTLQLKTGTNTPTIRGEWNAQLQNGKSRSGPIAVDRFLLPWAEPNIPGSESTATESIPQLADADWGRGRRVFLDSQVGCSKCHLSHGIGGTIGPDLSNLVHRDYDSVLRDVKNPGFSINPDYITYIVRLKDSRVLAGALRNEGSTYRITDQNALTTTFSEDEIDELKPTTVSIMPDGIVEKLDKKSLNDLLAYLLLKPPHMPIEKDVARPKLRTRAEVESALASSDLASTARTEGISQRASKRPLKILLVAGKKDHGPGEHDYPAWLRMWSQLMSAAEEVSVSTAMEWPTEEQLNVADTIVFFQRGKWNLERSNAIDALLQKGIGLVYIHWAIEGGIDASLFAERIGLAGYAKETRYRHGPLKLDFRVGSKHPIARNFEALDLVDESYWKLRGDPSKIDTIGAATEEGNVWPLFWTMEPGPGRVFVSVPGHYSWTFDDPMFRILLLRGIAWSARESVDRFNELVLLGVPIQD